MNALISFLKKEKLAIAVLFLIAIIIPLMNLRPYWDDNPRFSTGYIGLLIQGRPLNELFYRFISGGPGLSPDVYQMNLILFMLMAITLLRIKYLRDNTILFMLIFCNPFFIENLSYHVDVIGMVAAYVLAIHAAFYENEKTKKMFFISLLLALTSVLGYQSGFNAFFFSFIIATILDYHRDGRFCFKNIKVRFAVLCIILPFCKFITFLLGLLLSLIGKDANAYIETRLSIDISVAVNNALDFLTLFSGSFNYLQVSIFIISMTLLAISSVNAFLRRNISVSVMFFVPITCIFVSIFPYVLISASNIVSSRVLFGFTGFYLSMYVITYYFSRSQTLKLLISILMIFYIFSYVSFVSVYANAYNKFYDSEVSTLKNIQSLIQYDSKGDVGDVMLCGDNKVTNGYILNAYTEYPILKNVFRSFLSSEYWLNGVRSFSNINDIDLNIVECKKSNNPQEKKIFSNNRYDILRDDRNYLVNFK